jgi:sporulation protein YlmC with PRC-barrel domain
VEVPDYSALDGVQVTNEDGEKLGTVGGLFLDDETEIPTWVSVHSGLFGTHQCLVPLAQARFSDERLFVPYSKDDLALAPHHDPDVALTADQEQTLFAHYNVGYSDADAPGPHTGVEATETGLVGLPDTGSHPVDLAEVDALAPDLPGVPGLPKTHATRLRRYEPAPHIGP